MSGQKRASPPWRENTAAPLKKRSVHGVNLPPNYAPPGTASYLQKQRSEGPQVRSSCVLGIDSFHRESRNDGWVTSLSHS